MSDAALAKASAQIAAAQRGVPAIKAFFDAPTFTVTYVVHDPETRRAAVIDSVLTYDPASGRTSTDAAEPVLAYIRDQGLAVDWHLETHAHADHLSAAPFLQKVLGGRIAIGAHICEVQKTFGILFNAGPDFARDGSDFDQLWADGDSFSIGTLSVTVLHVPGHTPACVAYVIGDAVFVGDTMFMPDYGTARADFPGGDARTLFRSLRRILELPPETRLFLCHDYLPEGRDHYVWETTVAEQRRANVHAHDGVTEDEFVAMREARDQTLAVPRLILPSVQVNMRAGHLPPAEDNGVVYLKIPVNQL
jgi:glyoxylase-like metal-dependent hydrolase (beta-lactamase superfamily II)